MKQLTPLVALVLAVVYVSVTGFQCGSAEITTAKLAMQQRDWKKAEESLMKEVAKNDKNEEAWYMLGQVRSELKDHIGMDEAFTKALAAGNSHKTEIDRYRLAAWASNYNEGIAAYNEGRDDPAKYDKAVSLFKTAIAMAPDSASTYYVAGLASYAKKDNNQAISFLKTCLQKDPRRTEAARVLGDLHMNQGNAKADAKDESGAIAEYRLAADALLKAYEADPKDPENIRSLITAYELSKQDDKILELTSDCIKQDKFNRLCRYAYGLYLIKKDRFEDGITQFQKMIEIEPDNKDDMYQDGVYNVGVAYQNWGVALKAESDKKVEDSKGKEKADLRYKDKFKSAVTYFEKVTEFKKDDPTIYQALGRLYANLNMTKEAKAAFDTADKLLKGE